MAGRGGGRGRPRLSRRNAEAATVRVVAESGSETVDRALLEAPDPELARTALSRVGADPRPRTAGTSRRAAGGSACLGLLHRRRRPVGSPSGRDGRARRHRGAERPAARRRAPYRRRARGTRGRAQALPSPRHAPRRRARPRRSDARGCGRRDLVGGGGVPLRGLPAGGGRAAPGGHRPRQARRRRAELRERRRPALRARGRWVGPSRCCRARRGHADRAPRRAHRRGDRAPRGSGATTRRTGRRAVPKPRVDARVLRTSVRNVGAAGDDQGAARRRRSVDRLRVRLGRDPVRLSARSWSRARSTRSAAPRSAWRSTSGGAARSSPR